MRYIVRATQEGTTPGTPDAPADPAPVVRAAAAAGRGRRPLDPEVLSFLSGALVKPGAN